MKRVLLSLALLGLLVSSPVLAAPTITPGTKGTTATTFGINCTNDAHYWALYNNSTKAMALNGECDDTTVDIQYPGNYILVVSAADLSAGVKYEDAVVTESFEFLQVTPDFSTGGSEVEMGFGSHFNDFVQQIGSFLVTNMPVVLASLAALIGLGFLITRVRRWIGKKA